MHEKIILNLFKNDTGIECQKCGKDFEESYIKIENN